jgi:hypothetical protein
VLTQESDKFENIAQPNQNRFRFRRNIRYNEYSMRSDRLRTSDSLGILGFGDSVLNGGVQTEQDSLATYLIENYINQKHITDIQASDFISTCYMLLITGRDEIRCLNISYGSWEPDNCFVYIKEYRDFDAGLIFLVVNSHDRYDNIDFQKVVDVHLNYPYKQYVSA